MTLFPSGLNPLAGLGPAALAAPTSRTRAASTSLGRFT